MVFKAGVGPNDKVVGASESLKSHFTKSFGEPERRVGSFLGETPHRFELMSLDN